MSHCCNWCLYLGNYCIDFNETCTKLIVIKFAVHLSWLCWWGMLEVQILHTWLWGMWPTMCLCFWVGPVHLTILIINQSSLICSAIHSRSQLGFISWLTFTAMKARRLLFQAIPLYSLGSRPNQPNTDHFQYYGQGKDSHAFGHVFMFWWKV